MEITFGPYSKEDIPVLTALWNEVLSDGVAFPGEVLYNEPDFSEYMGQQTAVNCMLADGKIAGYYILHPNNIGRCSHVANASYLMDKRFRGQHLGNKLVGHSIAAARKAGFRGMQFNAVVSENYPALHIYQNAGFSIVGTIPGGFRVKDGRYVDMYVMYLPLS